MFENLRADIIRARKETNLRPNWFNQNIRVELHPRTLIVAAYRFAHWTRQQRIPVVRHLLMAAAGLVRRPLECLTGCFISPTAEIGPGFVVHGLYGVIIGGATRIGKNCTVHSDAKIACAVRSIGDDVSIGLGAVIAENVTIGSNVNVAPNSVVITDVPDNMTVMGVPARIRLRRPPLAQSAPPPSSANGSGVRSETQAQHGVR